DCRRLVATATARLELRAELAAQQDRLRTLHANGAHRTAPRRGAATPRGDGAARRRSAGLLAFCERPDLNSSLVTNGDLGVKGWALSRAGIRGVEALVDGEPRGTITYGALRVDVAADYSDYPDAERCGFVGTVPIKGLADGPHTLLLCVTAQDGRRAE